MVKLVIYSALKQQNVFVLMSAVCLYLETFWWWNKLLISPLKPQRILLLMSAVCLHFKTFWYCYQLFVYISKRFCIISCLFTFQNVLLFHHENQTAAKSSIRESYDHSLVNSWSKILCFEYFEENSTTIGQKYFEAIIGQLS